MSDWRVKRLGRVARMISGSGFPHEYQGRDTGDLPFVKVSDLRRSDNADGILSSANYVSRNDMRTLGARTIPTGSIVFPKIGAALLGNARALTLTECLIDNNLMAIVPREGDGRYWKYALSMVDLGELSGSGPLPYVSDSQVRDLRLPFPPIAEQRRIADFLDAETALIDLLVQQRTRQRDALDELLLSMIDNTIGQVRKSSMVRLGYLALVQTGVTVDGNRQHDADVVTLPYLRVANVQAGYVDLNDIAEITLPRSAAAASRLRAGDVLMTEGGDLDKLGRGTVWYGEIEGCLHQNHVFAVRPDPDILTPEYLALLTRAPMARRYFESTGNRTTNLASTSSGKIRDFRIPLIDTATQHTIVTEIDARVRSISQFEERISRQLSLLAERRQALITAAVTGQIDVTTVRGLSPSGGVAV